MNDDGEDDEEGNVNDDGECLLDLGGVSNIP